MPRGIGGWNLEARHGSQSRECGGGVVEVEVEAAVEVTFSSICLSLQTPTLHMDWGLCLTMR